MLVDHVRSATRCRGDHQPRDYATFPLVGGLLIEAAAARARPTRGDLGFSLLVFVGFIVAILLNFVGIAGDYVFHNRGSLAHEFRTIFLPVLPSQVVSALLSVTSRSSTPAAGSRAGVLSSCWSRSSTCCASCCSRRTAPSGWRRCSSAC